MVPVVPDGTNAVPVSPPVPAPVAMKEIPTVFAEAPNNVKLVLPTFSIM